MKKLLLTPIFWVLVCTALPTAALFHPGLPATHDGADHVARIANFYLSLREGNPVPRWAANLNWGYGHPILMFLYPLPSYVASLFHMVGFTLVDSTKLVFGTALLASVAAMYLWMNAAFGKRAGFIGALLYVFAPYRFVDLYVRGALGEHVAFIFPPLILYFLYKLAYAQRPKQRVFYSIGTAVSLALLILAHNAIAIMFIPIIGLYTFYLLFTQTKQKLFFGFASVASIIAGFGLAAFFWVPAFFEGKYTLRDIVTGKEALTRFVPWTWFVYSPWNYGQGDTLTKSLGFAQWIGVIVSAAAVWKTKQIKHRILLLGAIGILFGSFFIMTAWSRPIWIAVTTLQKFQFPWRFLSVSVFAAAVIGGIAVQELTQRLKYKQLLMIGFSLLILGSTIGMWLPNAYVNHDESYYSGIYMSTTDTGESSPIWSMRFMEQVPVHTTQIISGQATITPGRRSTIQHNYTVDVQTTARIVENTLYFPQWRVYVDGQLTPVEFQDQIYRGIIIFWVTPGHHEVVVRFENTKLRTVSEQISIATLAIIGCMGIGVFLWKKRK